MGLAGCTSSRCAKTHHFFFDAIRRPGAKCRHKPNLFFFSPSYMQGLLEEADGPYDRALQLAEELFGAESVKVATSLNNKAALLSDMVGSLGC